jgi:hypothetical protein
VIRRLKTRKFLNSRQGATALYVNYDVVSICYSIYESDVLIHLQTVGRTYGDLRVVSSSFKSLFLNTSTKREVFSVI